MDCIVEEYNQSLRLRKSDLPLSAVALFPEVTLLMEKFATTSKRCGSSCKCPTIRRAGWMEALAPCPWIKKLACEKEWERQLQAILNRPGLRQMGSLPFTKASQSRMRLLYNWTISWCEAVVKLRFNPCKTSWLRLPHSAYPLKKWSIGSRTVAIMMDRFPTWWASMRWLSAFFWFCRVSSWKTVVPPFL